MTARDNHRGFPNRIHHKGGERLIRAFWCGAKTPRSPGVHECIGPKEKRRNDKRYLGTSRKGPGLGMWSYFSECDVMR